MKLKVMISLVMAVTLLGSVSVFADIPPDVGTVERAELSGDAASILSSYFDMASRPFPKEIGSIGVENPFKDNVKEQQTSGSVGTMENRGYKIVIGCASGYHTSNCKLVRTWK